jgi:hypothetical protein
VGSFVGGNFVLPITKLRDELLWVYVFSKLRSVTDFFFMFWYIPDVFLRVALHPSIDVDIVVTFSLKKDI